jgi:heme A synthase
VSLFRRLSLTALVLGFGHVVFGAIVRISGSGLGCGDHWPKCRGEWFPPFDRMDLVIEISHRYFAAALSTSIGVLLVFALLRRREPGVSGPDGILRPALWSFALVVAAALFGAATVKLELTNPYVTVVHLALAMALLAALCSAVIRTGGFGSSLVRPGVASPRTVRGAAIGAGLTFIALALGGLTANVPGANSSCWGFPLCRGDIVWSSNGLQIQLAHRIVAFVLAGHLVGLLIGVTKRRESPAVLTLARLSLATVVLQVLVAAALVEMQLPPLLRSLHEAAGTLLWIVTIAFAIVARRGAFDPVASMDAATRGSLSVRSAQA